MEMKKYMTPEMEIVELKLNQALLVESSGETEGGGGSLPDDITPGAAPHKAPCAPEFIKYASSTIGCD